MTRPDRQNSPASPPTRILDCRGHKCPVPVLRMEAALRDLAAEERLRIMADDPLAEIDIPHFCRQTGRQARRVEGACIIFDIE